MANGDVVISGGTTCLVNLDFVNNVTVLPGAGLYMSGTNVFGRIISHNATTMILCGNEVFGRTVIIGTKSYAVIGEGTDGHTCNGNAFSDTVQLLQNGKGTGSVGGLEFGGNTIVNGDLNVVFNGGSSGVEDHAIEIEGNSIGGRLLCQGNTTAPVNDNHPNYAGSRAGNAPCTSPGF